MLHIPHQYVNNGLGYQENPQKTQSIGQQKKDLGILKIQSQKQPREKVQ